MKSENVYPLGSHSQNYAHERPYREREQCFKGVSVAAVWAHWSCRLFMIVVGVPKGGKMGM